MFFLEAEAQKDVEYKNRNVYAVVTAARYVKGQFFQFIPDAAQAPEVVLFFKCYNQVFKCGGEGRLITEKGLAIHAGRNALYYSLGRRGAMKTWEAAQALIRADIASSNFGELAPEVVDQLINKAKDAYDALQN